MDPLPLSAAFWNANTGLFFTGVALLSLAIGSFLNVVILRLPVMMDQAWRRDSRELLESPEIAPGSPPVTLAHPPSTCPKCGHRIRPWENVPVLSYAFLRGRCAGCRAPISARYPAVELLAAALSLAVAWKLGAGWQMAAALVLTWSLLALTVIDLDHQLLPDSITQPLLWLGLILNSGGLFVPLQDAVWGAAFGYLSLWSVYHAFKLVTGKEGMGFGDFKLLAALGAWMGWQSIPMVIVISSLLGALTGIALIVFRGRDRQAPMPFGPFLAGAGWVTLLWGERLYTVWLHQAAH